MLLLNKFQANGFGWHTGQASSAQAKGDGTPNSGDNDDWHLAPGPFDVIAHGGWKTGSASSAQVKGDGNPNTGDNDDYHLAPGPFDVIAHNFKWQTGAKTSFNQQMA